jgi:hypothetical protein
MAVPDVKALRCALEESGVSAQRIPQTITRLMRPPLSLHFSASDDADRLGLPFNPDEAARMFCSKAWKDLTRTERKRARRQWEWAVNESDSINVSSRGRPAVIDSAFVLWCARVLTEARGERLTFGRHWEGGRPRGLEAFLIVLKQSRAALDRLTDRVTKNQTYDDPRHLEAIAQLLKLERSSGKDQSAKTFAAKCTAFGLGPTANHIADDPQMFRYAVMLTRIERHRARVPN